MSQRVHRVDVGGARIRTDHKTVQGHARVPAALSRTGVQLYPQADGTVRREYRPPEEVFSPTSMQTFDTATLVVGHPAMVDPGNWKDHAVGEVRAAKQDGKYVVADLVVRNQATLDKIDSGQLEELSCGYDCTLDFSPGVSPDGEKYDAIQRDISINHVGLGPKNWGRAGSEVRLRLDGGVVAYLDADEARTRPAVMDATEIAALQKEVAEAKTRADAAEAKLKSANAPTVVAPAAAPAARADANLDSLLAQRDEAVEKAKNLEKLTSKEHLDSIVQQRIAVLDGARLLHGKADISVAGTVRDIQVAAIVARDKDFKADGRSDEYVAARFDAKVEDLRKAGASLAALNVASVVQQHADGTTQDSDAEFAELTKRYDRALDFPQLYAAAEPWKNGEVAARNAALTAMKGT